MHCPAGSPSQVTHLLTASEWGCRCWSRPRPWWISKSWRRTRRSRRSKSSCCCRRSRQRRWCSPRSSTSGRWQQQQCRTWRRTSYSFLTADFGQPAFNGGGHRSWTAKLSVRTVPDKLLGRPPKKERKQSFFRPDKPTSSMDKIFYDIFTTRGKKRKHNCFPKQNKTSTSFFTKNSV